MEGAMLHYCLNDSGVLLAFHPARLDRRKGFVGNKMITPIKKPTEGDLLDWQKDLNNQVNKIR